MTKSDWKKSYIHRLVNTHKMPLKEAKENFKAIPPEDLKEYLKDDVDPGEMADDEVSYMMGDC